MRNRSKYAQDIESYGQLKIFLRQQTMDECYCSVTPIHDIMASKNVP